jgi:hypothetical protein
MREYAVNKTREQIEPWRAAMPRQRTCGYRPVMPSNYCKMLLNSNNQLKNEVQTPGVS